jgi:hypothetical protein
MFSARCLLCSMPGHYASSCNQKSEQEQMGFVPKGPPTDYFLGNLSQNGKEIDVSGWFQGKSRSGPFAPPVFQSFSKFSQFLCSRNSVPGDVSPPPDLRLELFCQVQGPHLLLDSLVQRSIPASSMAFQLADPAPFMPRIFQRLEVPGRRVMARAISRRTPLIHEDWALMIIEPLPQHQVSFGAIRNVANQFSL